jgi:hypothetical protein
MLDGIFEVEVNGMDNRKDVITGLREYADFLEQHPSVPEPCITTFNVFAWSPDEFRAMAREIGAAKKGENGSWLYLRKTFGNGAVGFDLNTGRDAICTRKVVGTRIVPAKPATEATPETTEDIIEWDCPDSILAEVQ